MTKEELIALGLTDQQADKVLKAHKDAINNQYVPKHRFDEVNEENKTGKQTIASLNKQIEDLGSFKGTNEELTKQIETLTQQNAENQKQHDLKIAELKKTNAVELACMSYEHAPHDIEMLLREMDLAKISVNSDGKLNGFKEQADHIYEAKPFLFKSDSNSGRFGWNPKGTNPAEGKSGGSDSMSAAEQFGKQLAEGQAAASSTKAGMDFFFGLNK